jgi:hypothetical protein
MAVQRVRYCASPANSHTLPHPYLSLPLWVVSWLRAILKSLPPEQLQVWPVDKRVGNVRNDGAELAQPIVI